MHVIVAGGGAVGAQLASALATSGAEVVVVEVDAGRAGDLRARHPDVRVVTGDACTPETLEAAGALRADALVACTGDDPENLVISVLAKRHLDVPHVVARVNDEADRWLFDAAWGVDTAVSVASALVAAVGLAVPPSGVPSSGPPGSGVPGSGVPGSGVPGSGAPPDGGSRPW